MRIFRNAEERGVSTEEAASSLAEEKLLKKGSATPIHRSAYEGPETLSYLSGKGLDSASRAPLGVSR